MDQASGPTADRDAMLLVSALWSLLVYVPVAHWIWGGGWLQQMGVLDFAGGIVVHVTAGVAGLVAALYVGKRKGYPKTQMPPHSLTLSVVGAGMLWVGWFGFNAGSALAANGAAGMTMLATQVSAATAAVVWMFIEWARHGRPSVLGIITGAVAGLATGTRRDVPMVTLTTLGLASLTLSLADPRTAVLTATAGGLFGVWLTLAPGRCSR